MHVKARFKDLATKHKLSWDYDVGDKITDGAGNIHTAVRSCLIWQCGDRYGWRVRGNQYMFDFSGEESTLEKACKKVGEAMSTTLRIKPS